jgi:tetratricopeptide (TPR) repeat protein
VAQSYQAREAEIVSLLGRPLYSGPPGADRAKLEADLAAAQAQLAADMDDPGKLIWVGRRLGYLWRMNEAVAVFDQAIRAHPRYAPLYRHRGHRYVSMRRFDDAVADLERAAELIRGQPDEIEPDGAPNEKNIPLTTTQFNIWYHLGVARFLQGDDERAVSAFENANRVNRGIKDNVVATADWTYLALRRLGRDAQARALLDSIDPEWEMIENSAYHRRLLMYKGVITPDELLDLESASTLDLATLGFGLGAWHEIEGRKDDAQAVFRRVVAGPYWPAFGYIAAEVELVRMKKP